MLLSCTKIRTIFPTIIFLFFLLPGNISSDELPVVQKAKQLFEWGEYPQIIQTVPDYLSDTSRIIDSDKKSRLHLYLGVAYFAEGEVWKARDQFLTSLTLDSAITLDKNYVSHEIYDLFLETAHEIKQRRLEEEKRAQLLEQRKQVSQSNRAVIDSLDKTVKKGRKRGLLITAVSTTVLSVGFAGLSAYEYYLGDQEYDNFTAAAQLGDYREYKRLKSKIKKHDTRMAAYASATGGGTVLSTILYVIAHRKREKHIQSTMVNPTIFISMNRIGINFNF